MDGEGFASWGDLYSYKNISLYVSYGSYLLSFIQFSHPVIIFQTKSYNHVIPFIIKLKNLKVS